MRAWLPEARVTGPEPAVERDIEGLNRVFAEAFTDRYRRDGLVGFAPGFLTVTLTNEIATRGHPAPVLLSRRPADEKEAAMASGRRLVSDLVSGIDFSREILLTAELGLGDTSLVEGDTGLDAMAVWHSAPLADSRTRDEVRVLKLAARSDAAFDAAIGAVEAAAAKAGIRRIAVRCQSSYAEAFRRLVARGYRMRWTDLRITYKR